MGSWKCRHCGFLVIIQPSRPLRLCPKCGTPVTQGQADYEPVAEKRNRSGRIGSALAESLVNALDDEIEYVKREGGTRSYTIRNGERIGLVVGKSVYRFDYDGDRIETDVPVFLQLGESKEKLEAEVVSVVGQEITLATKSPLPDAIPRARMFADPLFILEKLRDRISSPLESFNLSLARKLFAEESPKLGRININTSSDLNEFQKSAIERCASSEVFFIWGPPGTGKTTTIASVITHAFTAGKTTLITSNTNVAVDNAITGAEKSIRECAGYKPGDMVRVGIPQAYVPDSVLPEQLAANRRQEIDNEISRLEKRNRQLLEQVKSVKPQLDVLDTLERLSADEISQREFLNATQNGLDTANTVVGELGGKLEKAKAMSRIERAIRGLNIDEITRTLNEDLERQRSLRDDLSSAQKVHAEMMKRLDWTRQQASQVTGSRSQLVEESGKALEESKQNTAEISRLQKSKGAIESEIIAKAKIVGTTLAKTWLRDEIFRRRFDLVVVDEASMATLPMLYFVAGLGTNVF